MTYKRPTKAIIAAAGFGTRFLPQTKAMPKEMLPIVDKPIIQYVVEELVEAGIKDIIIVTGYSKRSIEDHFDTPNAELSGVLQQGGKDELLEELHKIAGLANFVYVRQKDIQGNAAPVFCASHLIQDEPFMYMYADELVQASPGRTAQAIEVFEKTGGSVLPCVRMTEDGQYDRFGNVGVEEADGLLKVTGIKEKPGKANALSDMASVGGYIFTPDILKYIDEAAAKFDGDGELYIQNIIEDMIHDGKPFHAFNIEGKYYDAGDKLAYVQTVVDFALAREDIGPAFKQYLQDVLKQES